MRNPNISKSKLALGLAALTLLAGAAGCGDDAFDAFDDPVAEEGDDLTDPSEILCTGNGCGDDLKTTNNKTVLSAPNKVNGIYQVQLAGFEPLSGEVIHAAADAIGFDGVNVQLGSDTSQGSLSVQIKREGNSSLATEFTGLYDEMIRGRTTPGDEVQAGVSDLSKLNFYFSGHLILEVVPDPEGDPDTRVTYRTDLPLGFAQQHVGSKNVWWIGQEDPFDHGPDYNVLGELEVDATNVEDPSDAAKIFIRPRSNSSDQFDFSAIAHFGL